MAHSKIQSLIRQFNERYARKEYLRVRTQNIQDMPTLDSTLRHIGSFHFTLQKT